MVGSIFPLDILYLIVYHPKDFLLVLILVVLSHKTTKLKLFTRTALKKFQRGEDLLSHKSCWTIEFSIENNSWKKNSEKDFNFCLYTNFLFETSLIIVYKNKHITANRHKLAKQKIYPIVCLQFLVRISFETYIIQQILISNCCLDFSILILHLKEISSYFPKGDYFFSKNNFLWLPPFIFGIFGFPPNQLIYLVINLFWKILIKTCCQSNLDDFN